MQLKKKSALITIVVLCSFLNQVVSNKRTVCTLAETENVADIGFFYSTQMVNQQTKVYVSSMEADWAIECGRTLYQEIASPVQFTQIEYLNPYHINPEPLIRNYYYATVTEPKIVGKKLLKNDLESLLFILNFMEDASSSYGISDANNAILGYIRSINKQYVGSYLNLIDEWKIICGNHQSSLFSMMDAMYAGGGIKIKEYFASFVSQNEYNQEEHGIVRDSYLQLDLKLVDPYNHNNRLDLIHFFASLDGTFENTGETTQQYIVFDYLTKDIYRYLISWGGDLQTAAKAIHYSNLYVFDFDDILFGNYSFSYDDYYADIDAVNIATRIDLSSCESISALISNYYDNLILETFFREELFIEKVASTANPSYSYLSDYSAFVSITADILKMNGNLQDNGFVMYDYVKYHLMSVDNGAFASYFFRHNLEVTFLEHLGIFLV